GEHVELEDEYLFPMLKSSDVAGCRQNVGNRWMIVPQRSLSASTQEIEMRAPDTWKYLRAHREYLAKRKSSIYRGKPDFAIFGVGSYSFSSWKVAISGLYKSLRFTKVGPFQGKPVVLDDTSNFLPCPSEASATLLMSLLESTEAQTFYRAMIFWDAKRPI